MRTVLVLVLLAMTSVASAEMYTWRDKGGTVFYTNSLHEIPARYLRKARVYDIATGKKGGLATEQPVAPAAPQHVDTPAQQPAPVPEPAAAAPIAAPVAAGVNGIATSPAAASPAGAVVGVPVQRSRGTLAERRARRRQVVTGDPVLE